MTASKTPPHWTHSTTANIAHYHTQTSPSTNSELMHAIGAGLLPTDLPALLTADTQTAGRGQHGRSWLSPVGNAYLSLYVPIGNDEGDESVRLCQLSGALSLAVGFYLAKMPIIQSLNQLGMAQNQPLIGVKWANDVGFYDDKALFNKLAGILIEPVLMGNRMVGVIVGVGINVNFTPAITDGLYHAVSLMDIAHARRSCSDVDLAILDNVPSSLDHQSLYEPMTKALIQAVHLHNQRTNHALPSSFIQAFNDAHVLQGMPVAIYGQNNMDTPTHTGICQGINPDGSLLLSDGQVVFSVFAGMAKRMVHE